MSKTKTDDADAPTTGKCNFVVKHNGMGFPVGSVVPLHTFPSYPYRHVELGALEETTADCTVDPADVPRADVIHLEDDKLIEENTKLRALLTDLPQRAATHKAEVETLKAENEKLKADLDAANADLSLARRAAGIKTAEAEQRRFEEGAKPVPAPPAHAIDPKPAPTSAPHPHQKK